MFITTLRLSNAVECKSLLYLTPSYSSKFETTLHLCLHHIFTNNKQIGLITCEMYSYIYIDLICIYDISETHVENKCFTHNSLQILHEKNAIKSSNVRLTIMHPVTMQTNKCV